MTAATRKELYAARCLHRRLLRDGYQEIAETQCVALGQVGAPRKCQTLAWVDRHFAPSWVMHLYTSIDMEYRKNGLWNSEEWYARSRVLFGRAEKDEAFRNRCLATVEMGGAGGMWVLLESMPCE